MHHDVGPLDQRGDGGIVPHAAFGEFDPFGERAMQEVLHVAQPARGEIIEEHDAITAREESVSKM